MKTVLITDKLISLSKEIAKEAQENARIFPCDRPFLVESGYLNELMKFDSKEVILSHINLSNPTYTVQFLFCTPELWKNISTDDLIEIIENTSNEVSLYALIQFVYKYLELNCIPLILENENLSAKLKMDIVDYIKNQYPNLYKTEDDIIDIEHGELGVNNDDWIYIKQKMISENTISEYLESEQLIAYVNNFDG